MSSGYSSVYYACVNAVNPTKKGAAPHTWGTYSYGNGAGARWGYALRPNTCAHCGGVIITAGSQAQLTANIQYEQSKEEPNE